MVGARLGMRSDSVCGEGLPYLEGYWRERGFSVSVAPAHFGNQRYSRTVDDQNFKQLGHARDRLSYSQQPRAAVERVILRTSVPQLA